MPPTKPDARTSFTFWGVTVPLNPVTATILTLVLITGLAAAIYQKVWADPERQVLTLKQALEQQAADAEEYGRHAMEEPTKHELWEDSDGSLAVRVYPDHCVMIQRKVRGAIRTRIIQDLAKAPAPPAVPKLSFSFVPTLHAIGQNPCGRGCLNPHPGNHRSWTGRQLGNGWIEWWRQWPEGCTHWQAYHPQSGSWATFPNGTPAVNWTCCVH